MAGDANQEIRESAIAAIGALWVLIGDKPIQVSPEHHILFVSR